MRPICNYRCADCFSGMGTGTRQLDGALSWDETRRILDCAHDLGVLSVEISGEGEPLMDRTRLEQIIQHNNDLGMLTTIFTNGSLLDENFLTLCVDNNVSIAISLDYLNQEGYEQDVCRRGSFDVLMRNVELARDILGGYQISDNGSAVYRLAIHSIVGGRNLDEISRISDFCGGEVGAEILHSVAPIANVGNAVAHPELTIVSEEMVNDVVDEFSRGDLILCDSAVDECGSDRCATFYYGLGIRHNGDVLFDAHAYETAGAIGNLRDSDVNFDLGVLARRQRELVGLFYRDFGAGFCPLRHSNYSDFVRYLNGSRDD